MADNTTELEVLDEIVDVLGGTSGQHETVVPVLEDIRDLLGGGGGGGGYNPSLSVGRADALTGADETAQWAQRESTGSGAATVRSVQGAAVAWNQMVNGVDRNVTAYGLTMVYANGKATLSGVAEATNNFWLTDNNISVVNGHKYLMIGGSEDAHVYINVAGIGNAYDPIIVTAIATATTRAMLCFTNAADLTIPYVCYPMLFDLTAMFGAGNEPTTVAEFEQMFPAAYYPYSAPTLKPVQIAGIASTDSQGGELDSVEWATQELWGAGIYGDMLYADRKETRVGVVDLGTLTWFKGNALTDGTGHAFRSISIATGANNSNFTDIQCAVDPPFVAHAIAGAWESISLGQIFARTDTIIAGGDSSLTAAQFKESVSGVMFYYPLKADAITTTPISPALDMTYRVQAGGNESIIVPDGEVSAAPVLTVAEGESAADVVMDALACIAAPDGPVATANHALNTYLTMQGKLYKVTSAIAVGETIKSGTNVTQTTVMAELIARTA